MFIYFYSLFVFAQLERLQILVQKPREVNLRDANSGVSSPNKTARTEHMLSCLVGGLSVAFLPPSLPPTLHPSPPRFFLPALRSDCMSLPRSLTVRERMLPNAQPAVSKEPASRPRWCRILVLRERERETYSVEKARSPCLQPGSVED